MNEDNYQILGVSEQADESEILEAYRKRVKETHPDINDNPNAAEQFKRVREAYIALLSETEIDPFDDSSNYYYGGEATAESATYDGEAGKRTDRSGSGRTGGGDFESGTPTDNRTGPDSNTKHSESHDGKKAYSDEAFEAVYRVHERTSSGFNFDLVSFAIVPGLLLHITLKEYLKSFDTILYGAPFAWLYYFSLNFAGNYGSIGPYVLVIIFIVAMLVVSRVGVFASGTVTIYLIYSSWNGIVGLSIISIAQALHLVPVLVLCAMLSDIK